MSQVTLKSRKTFDDLSFNEARFVNEIWTNDIYAKDKKLTIMGFTFEKGDIRHVSVTKDPVIYSPIKLSDQALAQVHEEYRALENVFYNSGKDKVPKDFLWLRKKNAIKIYFRKHGDREFIEIAIVADVYRVETEKLRIYEDWLYRKERKEKFLLEQLQETANAL